MTFETDPYPGKSKILFIGLADSTHTHSWIDLLRDAALNVRLFALPDGGKPPVDWLVRTYLSGTDSPEGLDPNLRICLHPTQEERQQAKQLRRAAERLRTEVERKNPLLKLQHLWQRGFFIRPEIDGLFKIFGAALLPLFGFFFFSVLRFGKKTDRWFEYPSIISEIFQQAEQLLQPKAPSPEAWLANILQEWQPDIIHTIGLEPASFFYLAIRNQHGINCIGKWVVKAYGGPDLALHRFLPHYEPKIRRIFSECDQFIADNQPNYDLAVSMGLEKEKICPLGILPGTGGVDIDELTGMWQGIPSQRPRMILWPKAYECPASKGLPVLEAIRLAWDRMTPCEIIMTAVTQPEMEYWFRNLPVEIQACCRLYPRISRTELLRLMGQSRVLLSPSLSDGIPNVLYEAMATGVFPIFSPLDTITPIVESEKNVLFARNLYPQEIADALIRAMTDDRLIDEAAQRNLALVKKLADRHAIRSQVISYYQDLRRFTNPTPVPSPKWGGVKDSLSFGAMS